MINYIVLPLFLTVIAHQKYLDDLKNREPGALATDNVDVKNDSLISNMNVLGNAVHRMEEKDRQKRGIGIRVNDIPNLYAADMD
jgi:hypothetical protein